MNPYHTYTVTTQGAVALTAATVRTVLQLDGSSVRRAQVLAWGISFDGVAETDDEVRIRLLRQTTDGTRTGATVVKHDPDSPTSGVTALRNFSGTEPTADDVYDAVRMHPQGINMTREYPHLSAPSMRNSVTDRIGLDVLSPVAHNCVAWLTWAEW